MDSQNGARLVVTLEDVSPSRPTQRALSRPRHTDATSFGLGGAKMSARLSKADGTRLGEAHGRWYENQLDQHSIDNGVWLDSRRAFNWFARRLARQLSGDDND